MSMGSVISRSLAVRMGVCATLVIIEQDLAGCAAAPGDDIGFSAQASLNPNSLNPNSLNPNALDPDALDPGALGAGALDPDAMSPGVLGAIQDPGDAGARSREFLRYAVGCALRADQTVDFTWTDLGGAAHAESYPGLLGLAPAWATRALDLAAQQWVTACLASRVNALGVSVMLSSRGTHPALGSTSQENTTYGTREAVFFGNLFTNAPRVYACYDPLSVLPSQMAHRVCAQPDYLALDPNALLHGYDCGAIEVIGPCSGLGGLITLGVCANEDWRARYLYDCKPPGGAQVIPSITTFLQGPIPW